MVDCHTRAQRGTPRSQRRGPGGRDGAAKDGREPRYRVPGADSREQMGAGGAPEAGGEEEDADGLSAGPVGVRNTLKEAVSEAPIQRPRTALEKPAAGDVWIWC